MKLSILISMLIFVFSFSVFAQEAENERVKGIELYKQGEFQKAVESLEKAVEIDKSNQESLLYLGMSYARLKLDDKAVRALKKADKLPLRIFGKNEKDIVIISKPRPGYTDEARMNSVQGTVAIAIEFKPDGTLGNGFLVAGLPSGLTRESVKALAKIKFQPATKDDNPVLTIKIIKYSFTIY